MNYWRLTDKRRENLVKLAVSAFTVDLAAVLAPLALRTQPFSVSIFLFGWLLLICLVGVIYFLER